MREPPSLEEEAAMSLYGDYEPYSAPAGSGREEIRLDWSMIDASYHDNSYTVELNDREKFKVEFKFDETSHPADYDCYPPDIMEAWSHDEWYYIGVIVTPLHVPESAQFELSDSLWGLEFGFPLDPPQEHGGRAYTRTGEDYQLLVYPVPDMIGNVRANVARWDLQAAIDSYMYS